jgi:pSer/pThr/pTyr-binding forkhead associated (FHA) protein
MDAWQLNESRGIGGSDRVWRLRKEGDGLTVGRAAYCDIQVLSQSVEKKHSVIKWDERKGSYVIHDLGSSNGVRWIV